jgi:hypothetical protein
MPAQRVKRRDFGYPKKKRLNGDGKRPQPAAPLCRSVESVSSPRGRETKASRQHFA